MSYAQLLEKLKISIEQYKINGEEAYRRGYEDSRRISNPLSYVRDAELLNTFIEITHQVREMARDKQISTDTWAIYQKKKDDLKEEILRRMHHE